MSVEFRIGEEQIKEYRIRLGEKIRLIREQRGYSQEELAEMMNINRSTISKIENGKFSITVDYLIRFSVCLNYEFKVVEKKRRVDKSSVEKRICKHTLKKIYL